MRVDDSTSVRTQRGLTKEAFEQLLGWLDEDRDRAADKYEQIRIRLIKLFEIRGCANSEDLADDTIDRVARRVHEVATTYEGNPALYFHGVARMVHLEYLRKQPRVVPALYEDAAEETERRLDCLEGCLDRLSLSNRELILHYYEDENKSAEDVRKEIAQRLGISPNAVRIRAHRIRDVLSRCVRDCVTLKEPRVNVNRGYQDE